MIDLMLKNKNINIHVENEHGVNAFWVAAFYGHGTIMTILAKRSINTLSKNFKHVNALHLAVTQDHLHIVKHLLNSDFPLDLQTKDGMTALMLAAYHGQKDIVDLIMDHLKQMGD